MNTKNTEIKSVEYSSNGKIITFNKPLVMAIVNITPDSFYDGGKYESDQDVLRDVEEKIARGADIIDLGAASSRPGAQEISTDEEWHRLKPVLTAIRQHFPDTMISVDTYRAKVAKQAVQCGADMINDIGGGTLDNEMFETIAGLNVPYVLMHIKGQPKTMQNAPEYVNVVSELETYFSDRIKQLHTLGFKKIILDPGFGFGKTLEQNYRLLQQLHCFAKFQLPVLAGLSRKSMINQVIGTSPVTALNGTTVLNTLALVNGARILRVHDVSEAKQTIQLFDAYSSQS